MKNALTATITTLPEQLRRSLTWDRGKEMSAHVQFTIKTGLPAYFADPQSPWQRGTNWPGLFMILVGCPAWRWGKYLSGRGSCAC